MDFAENINKYICEKIYVIKLQLIIQVNCTNYKMIKQIAWLITATFNFWI